MKRTSPYSPARGLSRAAFVFPLLTIILSAALPAVAGAQEIRVAADRDYWHAVRPLIAEAESTLHISQLYLNPDRLGLRLLDDLEAAAERGVELKVLFNLDESRNRQAVERLTEAGAKVVHGGRRPPGRLHAKLVVADRERALVGSTNWSGVSMYHNREINLLVADPEVAGFFADWIEALQEDPAGEPGLPPVMDGRRRTVVDREHAGVIRSQLEEASERIWLGIYVFRTYFGTAHEGSTSDRLAEKLAEKAADGVDVRIILDMSGFNETINEINLRTAAWFRERGVEVRFNRSHETAHWKLLLADGRALVGSMNWGYSGLDLHSEASILVGIPSVVEELAGYYRARWEEAKTPESREEPAAAPAP